MLPAPLRDPVAAMPEDGAVAGNTEWVGEGTCDGQVLAIGPLSAPQLSGDDVLHPTPKNRWAPETPHCSSNAWLEEVDV
jgi:hypothetical protein